MTNIRKQMQFGPAVALHFRVLGGAIRPKRANFARRSGLYRRSSNYRRVGIYRGSQHCLAIAVSVRLKHVARQKSKLFLSIGVGTATFAASVYTNQALLLRQSGEVATSQVAPGSSAGIKYKSTFEGRVIFKN